MYFTFTIRNHQTVQLLDQTGLGIQVAAITPTKKGVFTLTFASEYSNIMLFAKLSLTYFEELDCL